MKIERGRDQKQARWVGAEGDIGEIATGGEFAAVEVPLDADPIIQGLQGKVEVGGGFQFNDRQAAGAVDGEEVEDTAVTAGEGRDLALDRVGEQRGVQGFEVRARLRFEPGFGVLAEERVIAVGGG